MPLILNQVDRQSLDDKERSALLIQQRDWLEQSVAITQNGERFGLFDRDFSTAFWPSKCAFNEAGLERILRFPKLA